MDDELEKTHAEDSDDTVSEDGQYLQYRVVTSADAFTRARLDYHTP